MNKVKNQSSVESLNALYSEISKSKLTDNDIKQITTRDYISNETKQKLQQKLKCFDLTRNITQNIPYASYKIMEHLIENIMPVQFQMSSQFSEIIEAQVRPKQFHATKMNERQDTNSRNSIGYGIWYKNYYEPLEKFIEQLPYTGSNPYLRNGAFNNHLAQGHQIPFTGEQINGGGEIQSIWRVPTWGNSSNCHAEPCNEKTSQPQSASRAQYLGYLQSLAIDAWLGCDHEQFIKKNLDAGVLTLNISNLFKNDNFLHKQIQHVEKNLTTRIVDLENTQPNEDRLQEALEAKIKEQQRAYEAEQKKLQEALQEALEKKLQETLEKKYEAKQKELQEAYEAKQKALDTKIKEQQLAYEAEQKKLQEALQEALEKKLQETLEKKYEAKQKELQEAYEAKQKALEAKIQENIESMKKIETDYHDKIKELEENKTTNNQVLQSSIAKINELMENFQSDTNKVKDEYSQLSEALKKEKDNALAAIAENKNQAKELITKIETDYHDKIKELEENKTTNNQVLQSSIAKINELMENFQSDTNKVKDEYSQLFGELKKEKDNALAAIAENKNQAKELITKIEANYDDKIKVLEENKTTNNQVLQSSIAKINELMENFQSDTNKVKDEYSQLFEALKEEKDNALAAIADNNTQAKELIKKIETDYNNKIQELTKRQSDTLKQIELNYKNEQGKIDAAFVKLQTETKSTLAEVKESQEQAKLIIKEAEIKVAELNKINNKTERLIEDIKIWEELINKKVADIDLLSSRFNNLNDIYSADNRKLLKHAEDYKANMLEVNKLYAKVEQQISSLESQKQDVKKLIIDLEKISAGNNEVSTTILELKLQLKKLETEIKRLDDVKLNKTDFTDEIKRIQEDISVKLQKLNTDNKLPKSTHSSKPSLSTVNIQIALIDGVFTIANKSFVAINPNLKNTTQIYNNINKALEKLSPNDTGILQKIVGYALETCVTSVHKGQYNFKISDTFNFENWLKLQDNPTKQIAQDLNRRLTNDLHVKSIFTGDKFNLLHVALLQGILNAKNKKTTLQSDIFSDLGSSHKFPAKTKSSSDSARVSASNMYKKDANKSYKKTIKSSGSNVSLSSYAATIF